MKVSGLPIPSGLAECYESSGVTELYPPQEDCVRKGLFEGNNLLVAVPTASGKTIVAEMAMHHHIRDGGKCLYIVPLKALASEKYGDFSGKGVKVGISTGDFDHRDAFLGRNDIIVCTSEKADSLLRNATPWIRDITILIVDEVHLIDDPDRGPTLEMVITKLRRINPSMQIIALSATIGNPGALAGWLKAESVTSSWRPVDLRQGVYYEGEIHFHSEIRQVPFVSKYDDLNLMLDTINEGGQCLVFVSSRRNAEAFAKRAAKALNLQSKELAAYGKQLEKAAVTDQEKSLAHCVNLGAAFHHAGLRREARKVVEEGFRQGHIRCISSTPTLAAGLNLPARRVIVRDYRRYVSGEGMIPVPAREYHQMAGRAGRPHLDPYGEAVLIGHSSQDASELFSYYIDATPEDVNSQSASEHALTTHILSLIVSRFVRSREDLISFLQDTFYFHQKKSARLLGQVTERSIAFLDNAEMVVDASGMLEPTEYGILVSQLYIDPRGADSIVNGLLKSTEYSDLGLLQVICNTPDMFTLYVGNKDLHYLERFLLEHEHELWLEIPLGDDESFFRSLKTAMVLNDWSREVPDATICERYGIGPGDVYAMVESMNWLLHATGRLAHMFKRPFALLIQEYELCMKHGIKRELIPLVRIRNIGRVRARSLYNSGYTSPEKILSAGEDRIIPILGHGITDQVFRELRGKPTVQGMVQEPEEPQSSLFQFDGNGDEHRT
jgi:helicase